MKGAIAMNILMTLLLLNLMLFYAFPSSFSTAENVEMIQGLDTFGIDVDVNTTNNSAEFITDTGNTSEVMENTYGATGETSNWIPDIIANTIDWTLRAITFVGWVGAFLYAPSTIMSSMGAPQIITNIFILIYTIGYIFALYELLTGR